MHCFLLSDYFGNRISKWTIHTTSSCSVAHPIWLFRSVFTYAAISHVPKLFDNTKYILLAGPKVKELSHRYGEGT